MIKFNHLHVHPLAILLWSLLWTAILALTGLPVAASSLPQPSPQSTVPSPDTLRGCGGARFPAQNQAFEDEVLRLINKIRQNNGVLPLKRIEPLTSSARFHATDMSEENYFSHTSHDRVNGELVESCQWDDRLRTYYSGWSYIGENIAAGFSTPQAVVDAWMASPGHRQNILSPGNWETGIGYYKGHGSFTYYWVQDFGRRYDVYPVVIDGDDGTSDDGALTLYIYGEWDAVRLRVDQGEWSRWQPFVLPVQWQLKAAAGQHVITVEMRNATTSASASDNITLTRSTSEPHLNTLPDTFAFIYDVTHGNLAPGAQHIQPLAAGDDPAFTWQVTANEPWLSVTPSEGHGAEVVTIVPSVSGANLDDSYQAVVTVSLRRSDGALLAEKKITVTLTMMEATYTVFMPVVSGD